MLQQDAINIVQQYVSNLNNDGINIFKAYLFGSYARNQANENSDIDVLLVSDTFDTEDDVILSKPWSPKYRTDYRIEPIALGKMQFLSDDNSIILGAILREGLEIEFNA
ncbi:MAG: nucleotidyltransferase domain-containing protein [Bacteroidota bacterium]